MYQSSVDSNHMQAPCNLGIRHGSYTYKFISHTVEIYSIKHCLYKINYVCNNTVPRMKKSTGMAFFHIKNFMSCYITSKKKTSACGSQVGHMCVTSRLFCGSVGQMGQLTGETRFQS